MFSKTITGFVSKNGPASQNEVTTNQLVLHNYYNTRKYTAEIITKIK